VEDFEKNKKTDIFKVVKIRIIKEEK
jgi:hypothetical protein